MTPSPNDPWRVSWESLQGRAWWYLNHSAKLPPSVSRGQSFHGLPRLRLWDDAMGFGPETEPTTLTVYELFTDDDRREPVVREAVWQRTADLKRAHQEAKQSGQPAVFEPTIGVRDAVVPADQLGALLAEALGFRVSIAWFGDTEAITSDVGSRGFEFFSKDQPPAALKLEWSLDTPPEWEPVLDWLSRLRQFLEGCFSRR
jgi:hypothetical protein